MAHVVLTNKVTLILDVALLTNEFNTSGPIKLGLPGTTLLLNARFDKPQVSVGMAPRNFTAGHSIKKQIQSPGSKFEGWL